MKKSQKTSYLENYKKLSSHTWRQDSQSLRVLWQDLIRGLGISDCLKIIILLVFWKFLKKSQKTSYLENYKELSSHTWRQDSQSLRVLWQDLIRGLGISDFLKIIIILVFWKILKKSQKTSYLENYKELSSDTWRQDSLLWEYSDSTQLQGWELQVL